MNKNEMTKEIAKILNRNQSEVQDVVDLVQTILLREIIVNQDFSWSSLFNIKPKLKNLEQRKVIEHETEDGNIKVRLPAVNEPTIKLSSTVLDKARLYQYKQLAKKNNLQPQDWYKPFIEESEGIDENNLAE